MKKIFGILLIMVIIFLGLYCAGEWVVFTMSIKTFGLALASTLTGLFAIVVLFGMIGAFISEKLIE